MVKVSIGWYAVKSRQGKRTHIGDFVAAPTPQDSRFYHITLCGEGILFNDDKHDINNVDCPKCLKRKIHLENLIAKND